MENDKEFFKTEESFISWISAYYPAPGRMVSVEEYRKNVESWKRFIEEITKEIPN